MKTVCLLLSICCLAAPVAAAEVPVTYAGWALVTAVDDGDSFTVDIDGRTDEVRMLRIDAPEKDQPFGDVAGRYLTGLILHQRVYLNCTARGVYKRLLCRVRLHGQELAPILTGAGLAWGYHKSVRHFHTAARAQKLGLWGLPAAPIAPEDWRKRGSKNAGK